MPASLAVACIVAALVAAAFFAGAETALTAASRARLRALETAGDARAALVARLVATRSRLISAMLLGGQLVTIAASALATNELVSTRRRARRRLRHRDHDGADRRLRRSAAEDDRHRLSRPRLAADRAGGVVLRHRVRSDRQRGRGAGALHAAPVRRQPLDHDRASPATTSCAAQSTSSTAKAASRATSATCSAACSSSPR